MGINDRLARLESARRFDRPRPPLVIQLEGQTAEEAHELSESRHVPLERCRVITESYWRELYTKMWGDGGDEYLGNFGEYYANKSVAQIRAEQAAVRALIEPEQAHGNS